MPSTPKTKVRTLRRSHVARKAKFASTVAGTLKYGINVTRRSAIRLKIVDIKALNFAQSIKEQVKGATMAFPRMTASFAQITTDDGITGLGECRSRFNPEVGGAIIQNILGPVLIGQNPFDIEKLWQNMYNTMRWWGHSKGFFVEAISGVECALWDVMGKALKLPVYKLVGGRCRDKVEVYASTIHHDWFKDSSGLGQHAVGLVEKRIKAMKLSVGFGLEIDRENVKAIRDAVGSEVQIMVDATSAYNVHDAIKVGRMFEKYEVFFFEEPIPSENIDGYVEVSKALDLPIAAGECEYLRYGFKNLISRRGVDIVQPDVGKAGGILECKKIATMASAYDMPVAYHTGTGAIGCTAATLHLAASTPSFLKYEYMYRRNNPLNEELPVKPLTELKDGHLDIPEEPGLGFEFNREAMSKYLMK